MTEDYLIALGHFLLDLHGTKRTSLKLKGVLVSVTRDQITYNGKKDFPSKLESATLDDFECSVSLKLKIEFFAKKRN